MQVIYREFLEDDQKLPLWHNKTMDAIGKYLKETYVGEFIEILKKSISNETRLISIVSKPIKIVVVVVVFVVVFFCSQYWV